jgi:hypothetical protein
VTEGEVVVELPVTVITMPEGLVVADDLPEADLDMLPLVTVRLPEDLAVGDTVAELDVAVLLLIITMLEELEVNDVLDAVLVLVRFLEEQTEELMRPELELELVTMTIDEALEVGDTVIDELVNV